jgi:hypothetical protein
VLLELLLLDLGGELLGSQLRHLGVWVGGRGSGWGEARDGGGGGKNPRVAKSYSRSGRPYSSPSSAVCRRRSKSLPPEWPPLLLTRPPRRRGRGHRAVGGGAAGRIRPQYAMEEEAAPSSCSSPDVPWRRSRPPRTRLQRWGAGERRGDGGGGGADRVGVR